MAIAENYTMKIAKALKGTNRKDYRLGLKENIFLLLHLIRFLLLKLYTWNT